MKKRVGIGRRVWADGGVVEDGGRGLQKSARPFIRVPSCGFRHVLVEVVFLQVEFWLNEKAMI